jgi:ABC-type phosphate transport system substrate-binding protein
VNLIEKQVDVILAAEPPDEARALAESKGVAFELTAVAVDAFALIASSDNPARNLSVGQIRGIYRNRIVDGVIPSGATIRDRSPTFSGFVYAITHNGDAPESASRLVAWMLTDAGQAVIEDVGFVQIR